MPFGRIHAHAKDVDIDVEPINTRLSQAASKSLCPENPGDEHNQRLRGVWDKTICKKLEIPDTYRRVGVLVIQWAPHLDDLNCSVKMEALKKLFVGRLAFDCEVVNLTDSERITPQAQLTFAVEKLMNEYDGEARSHLLLIYYTGHGVLVGNELVLRSRQSNKRNVAPPPGTRVHEPVAMWKKVERTLDDATADVLVVLDTCFSGSVIKGLEGVRCFEYMTASGEDAPTDAPATNKSYTKHFLEACNEHLNKEPEAPLTTQDLYRAIVRKRTMSKAFRWPMSDCGSKSIKLARVERSTATVGEMARQGPDAPHLTLRFAFRETDRLGEDEVKILATEIAEAVRKAETQRPSGRLGGVP